MNFKELGLIAPITDALAREGYETPTPIQRGAIPPALEGRDVLGCAQTGTGKTCAFATPILQRMARAPKQGARVIRALVLTPTRELALQIQESFAVYGKALPLRSAVIFGGVGQAPQVDKIKRGLDILVATPGRLLDLHGQKLLDLSHVEYFVLDEADRMLDMGFIHDVRRILKLLPEKKQTLFFSATMPPEVTELVNSLLKNPARVAVDPISSPVEVIDQSLYYVDKANKTKLLISLLENPSIKNALVFTRTKHGANKVVTELVAAGVSAAAIHGNKSQTARVAALTGFKAGEVRVLVATDIAARGLDIEELSHVFNYNLPDVPETYVHRIGRTGRAGHDGTAVSFCEYGEMSDLKGVERLIGKKLPVVEDHAWPMQVLVKEEKKQTQRGGQRTPRAPRADKPAAAPKPAPRVQRAAPKTEKPAREAPRPAQAASARAERPAPKATPNAAPKAAAQTKAKTVPVGESAHARPHPLAQEKVMDATARLFASKSRTVTPKVSRPTPPAEQANPAPRAEKPAAQRTGKPAQQRSDKPVQKGEKSMQRSEKPTQRSQQRPTRRREPMRRDPTLDTRSGSQKDSTEQESLMKPYYLSRD